MCVTSFVQIQILEEENFRVSRQLVETVRERAIGHPPLSLVICVIQIVNLFVFWINNDNYEKVQTHNDISPL